MCLAIPTQITAIASDGTATVELGGVERQISLIMTPEAKVGDYVLVHTGYAITLMDPRRRRLRWRSLPSSLRSRIPCREVHRRVPRPGAGAALVAQIRREVAAHPECRPVRLMEFCGGHTHAIFHFGLRQMLEGDVEMRSGPGCPVCVTAARDLDRAMALADAQPNVILTTFGDMVRVPGSHGTLQEIRAEGADVRIVYSPLDALAIARPNPDHEVIFLGVGFETTAPGIAAVLLQAEQESTPNFSVLSLHKLTPPAMRAILDAGEVALDGIIGPGHVSAVIGSDAWAFLPADYGMPCAVAGFEPLDCSAPSRRWSTRGRGQAPGSSTPMPAACARGQPRRASRCSTGL
jgi:hydrogenase assembly chaperone HypC/HupF